MYPKTNIQAEPRKSSTAEIELKLKYLELLQRDPAKAKEDIDVQRERINRVCNSIEKDL